MGHGGRENTLTGREGYMKEWNPSIFSIMTTEIKQKNQQVWGKVPTLTSFQFFSSSVISSMSEGGPSGWNHWDESWWVFEVRAWSNTKCSSVPGAAGGKRGAQREGEPEEQWGAPSLGWRDFLPRALPSVVAQSLAGRSLRLASLSPLLARPGSSSLPCYPSPKPSPEVLRCLTLGRKS